MKHFINLLLRLMTTLCVGTALAGPGPHGPNGEHLDAPAATSASGLMRLPDGSVTVPKAAQRRMAIRTVLATIEDAAMTIELSGKVIADPNATGKVQARHGGRVEASDGGLPRPGQTVKRGQVLAVVQHHADPLAMSQQAAQRRELATQIELTQQRVKRYEALEGSVPRKDIDAARVELASFVDRERAIGRAINTRESLIAPLSGVVIQANATLGQMLEARDVVFEIVDPARLQIEALTTDVSLAQSIDSAALRDSVDAQLRILGGARSLRDGMLPIYFELQPSADQSMVDLAVGQSVTVVAQTKTRMKGIVLPQQAVVRDGANQPIVFIKKKAHRFVPQPVQTRVLDGRRLVVTSGLAADSRVVVDGAQLIAQIR
jgi:membrane fusion protein, heavy metal efflux system